MTTRPAPDLEPRGPHDAQRAIGATGLLARLNDAQVLAAADVHLGQRLALRTGESESVAAAVALVSRAVRDGAVCLDLNQVPSLVEGADIDIAAELPDPERWRTELLGSGLVADGTLHVTGDLVHFDRYHRQESDVLDALIERSRTTLPVDEQATQEALDRVFPAGEFDEKRAAVRRCLPLGTSVITGGPGTGKTTMVAGLLAVLQAQSATPLRVSLAAPTGKAAARLGEQVQRSAARFEDGDSALLTGLRATTLHSLLGRRPGSNTRFAHDRTNRLADDVVVIDEVSMVSLTMMARLLEALRPSTRLILVGDPDQLASVEAGAVLGDVVAGFRGAEASPVVGLSETFRFTDEIRDLAEAIRLGDAERTIELLRSASAGDEEGALIWWEHDADERLREVLLPPALAVRAAARAGDAQRAMAAIGQHRLLCAHRAGPAGVSWWNRQIEQWLASETGDLVHQRALVGRPLLVTANDRRLGVNNGDSAVIVQGPHGARLAVETAGDPLDLAVSRLASTETMHALTIHKSQGGQADEVTVLLPEASSRLLTRELLYTAVTRAQRRVRIVGTEASLRAALERRVLRASGLSIRLRERLSEPGGDDSAGEVAGDSRRTRPVR